MSFVIFVDFLLLQPINLKLLLLAPLAAMWFSHGFWVTLLVEILLKNQLMWQQYFFVYLELYKYYLLLCNASRVRLLCPWFIYNVFSKSFSTICGCQVAVTWSALFSCLYFDCYYLTSRWILRVFAMFHNNLTFCLYLGL